MKKTVAFGLASMLILGGAAQASAYFEQGNLVQVAYNEMTNEIATDLGAVDFTQNNVTLSTGADFSAAGALDTLSLAYFQDNSTVGSGIFDLYFATTQDTVSQFSDYVGNAYSFSNVALTVTGYYSGLGGPTVIADPANPKSYDKQMNSYSGAPGSYSKMNTIAAVGEADMAPLATPDSYVDMYLYHFVRDAATNTMALAAGTGTDYTAKLRLTSAGDTVLNPSAVPLPGTLLLFGSSLLGLFGIRRKNA